jgi:hypothetical protein
MTLLHDVLQGYLGAAVHDRFPHSGPKGGAVRSGWPRSVEHPQVQPAHETVRWWERSAFLRNALRGSEVRIRSFSCGTLVKLLLKLLDARNRMSERKYSVLHFRLAEGSFC